MYFEFDPKALYEWKQFKIQLEIRNNYFIY